MDNYAAARLAEALEINPMKIIAAAEAEREKDERKREFWQKMFLKMTATALGAVVLAFPVKDLDTVQTGHDAHYAQLEKWLKSALAGLANRLAGLARRLTANALGTGSATGTRQARNERRGHHAERRTRDRRTLADHRRQPTADRRNFAGQRRTTNGKQTTRHFDDCQ